MVTSLLTLQIGNNVSLNEFFSFITSIMHKALAKSAAVVYYNIRIWGYGAVGSASEWHSEGQGFESPYLHSTHPNDRMCFFVV